MMSAALEIVTSQMPDKPVRVLPLTWRDPHAVPAEELARTIAKLEKACLENPASADLRTCLGMAYAMNYDVYESMDTLEAARAIDPEHFYAQFKYAELLYRVRALERAEQETKRCLELARNGWELAMARQQLQVIRGLMREGTQKPAWTKPLLAPTISLLALFTVLSLMVVML